MKKSLSILSVLLILLGLTLVAFTVSNAHSEHGAKALTAPVVSSNQTTPAPSAPQIGYTPKFISPKSDTKVLILDTQISDTAVDITINQLENFRKEGIKQVYLVISSPGGVVLSGGRLIAYIDASPLNIDTVCEEMCASMAAHIFEAGRKRYMVDRSVLMFHKASGGASGTVEGMENEINTLRMYVDAFDAVAAFKSGIPYDVFKRLVANDLWLDSQHAKYLGLTDEIAFLAYDRATTFTVSSRMPQMPSAGPPSESAIDAPSYLPNLQ